MRYRTKPLIENTSNTIPQSLNGLSFSSGDAEKRNQTSENHRDTCDGFYGDIRRANTSERESSGQRSRCLLPITAEGRVSRSGLGRSVSLARHFPVVQFCLRGHASQPLVTVRSGMIRRKLKMPGSRCSQMAAIRVAISVLTEITDQVY